MTQWCRCCSDFFLLMESRDAISNMNVASLISLFLHDEVSYMGKLMIMVVYWVGGRGANE